MLLYAARLLALALQKQINNGLGGMLYQEENKCTPKMPCHLILGF